MDNIHADALQKNKQKTLIHCVFNVKSYLFVFLSQLKFCETD